MSSFDISDEWGIILGQEGSTNQLVADVREGKFLDVLRSPQARQILALVAQQRQNEAFTLYKVHLENAISKIDSIDALCIAVAALHAFIQANWTGPDLEEELLKPIQLLRRASPDSFPARSMNDDEDQGNSDGKLETALRSASLDYLTWAGEPAYHLCESPFLLVLALQTLNALPSSLHSRALWRLRASSIYSRVLDNPVAPPEDVIEEVRVLKEYLTTQRDASKDSEEAQRWNKLLAITLIDEGLTVQRSGKDREANERFLEAARADGLQYEITGALGKRTKFQKEDKTILVLLAKSVREDEAEKKEAEDGVEEEEAYDADPIELNGTPSGWKATADTNSATNMPSEMLHNDDTLLERTRFTSTTNNANADSNGTTNSVFTQDDITNPSILDPLDSCILLGLCLNIHNASPENGLTASQMSAFVQRVLAHARNWSVHTMGLLLRSRLEADRTRTVQRSTLQLQALLDQMPTSDSSVVERLQLVHELELPSKWEMQAELARRYAALGVLRSALEIFERVELWQEVVQCWGALGRQDKGIEVLRDLLQGTKDESDHVISAKKDRSQHVQVQLNSARQAKLWCLLGDLEVEKATEHYTQAWNVSSKRSARAARSLGAVAFAASDFAKATTWLRRALKIQPLYARTWFTLGCVYMRLDTIAGYIEAARCFRRCTALDDEDAESWNNLASCYLRLSQQSEGVLREAQMAEHADAVTDQRAVLSGIEEEDEDDRSQSDSDSLHSRDSGVAVQSDTESEAETEMGGSGQGAFDVKLLAHRALGKSLRFAHDDWRVWNNYMIVSVDCGLMADAVRSLVRVVELRSVSRVLPGSDPTSSSSIAESVDIAVVNRIVDAVIRAPSSEQDALVEHEDTSSTNVQAPVSKQANHNPNEGHGLWPTVRSLFENTLLPKISDMPDLWRAYARLLFWRGRLRSALDAHLTAWRTSYGAEGCDLTSQTIFVQAVEALTELCELLENFGHPSPTAKREPAMENWQFRARSLVRTFMGRTRDAFESDPSWDRLQELRDSLSPSRG
ncbi:TPR-like protein [Meira miltonrushii]|uniref:TPR-like protein n=1 Tax=Meira miltonrushii TaxID=1280837 RepID=A0A316V4J9_9BASI|nr:TPR-like protein [Meira miltonrushii]PWN32184.1 TPR-like protein [Meira miltonrushii]